VPNPASSQSIAEILHAMTASDDEIEFAAGSGRLGEGRSTAGDGTSNPGVNCTCCCN
jgi:hypothetical protein